jgi:ammonium transporter Rh
MSSIIVDQLSWKANMTEKEIHNDIKKEQSERKLSTSRYKSECEFNGKVVSEEAVQIQDSPRTLIRRKSIVLREAKEEPIKPKELSYWSKKGWAFIFILIEIGFLILYALFTTYDMSVNGSTKSLSVYPQFQDVNVMIFIGFGFLMTFLKSYSWSAVAKNYLLAAWAFQLSLLSLGFWKAVVTSNWNDKISLDIPAIVDGLFAAASILISFGAVLGKLHFFQLLFMTTIETIMYSLSMNIVYYIFSAKDIGGSMTIHTFGAYFGLSLSLITKRTDAKANPQNSSNYLSNLFAMIGTIFLFMYWPSFNGALATEEAQQRCYINTVLSICASCIIVFLLTLLFRDGKFHMENILNATLAGGVVVGASADIITEPWIAFLFGLAGGSISLVGFEIIGPWLEHKIGQIDTCGINSLHGMTGILGTLLSCFLTGYANSGQYGSETFNKIFPLVSNGTRSSAIQAAYGLAGLGVTLGFAIISGLITGLILKSSIFVKTFNLFKDEEAWHIQKEEPKAIELIMIEDPDNPEVLNHDQIIFRDS